MKALVRELLGDFKAAVRIGDPESIEAVMDRIRDLQDDDLPPAALLPLGEAVAALPLETLSGWIDDGDAAVRGIAAAAIGMKDQVDKTIPEEMVPHELLMYIAGDPVDEVRAALAAGLARRGARSGELAKRFLGDGSLQVRRTGLLLVRAGFLAMRSLGIFQNFDREEDHGFREDLVDALNRIAEDGRTGEVLDLLDGWAGREDPNLWVITRAVSAGWAQGHSERCLRILKRLEERVGENRSISRAMERHRSQTPKV